MKHGKRLTQHIVESLEGLDHGHASRCPAEADVTRNDAAAR